MPYNTNSTAKSGVKSNYNKDIIFYQSSFLASIRYNEKEKQLFVTFKTDGRQFRYDKVPKEQIDQALASTNRTGAISALIKQYSPEYVQTFSSDMLQLLLTPKKQYTWLAR